MSDKSEELGLIAAIRKYIGLKPGQAMLDFAAEIKALTPEDRAWFKERFAKEYGIKVIS